MLHQVKQSTGRGDHDVHTAVQGIGLRFLAHTTEDHGMADLEIAAIGGKALADLDGQLAGGGKDQRADGPFGLRRFRRQLLQDRDGEGGRLACAGLRATQQVAALYQVRNGLCLDGGGVGVAFLL